MNGSTYFRDEIGAARHRVTRVALGTGRPFGSLTQLSRRNARVWRIRWTRTASHVVKLACGDTPAQTDLAATWLHREVAVTTALHRAGLVANRIVDRGQEWASAATTWTLSEDLPGCRASLLVRNRHGDDDALLDICTRTVRAIARQHHAGPDVIGPTEPAIRALLDRPYGATPAGAEPILAALSRLRGPGARLVACHGDLSLHNVLVSGDDVHLVDWACARADVPALDLAPVFLWLARYTHGPQAGRRLLDAVGEAYRDHPADPTSGLGPHLARALLQWAGWHGPRYLDAAVRVGDRADAAGAVDALATEIDRIRRGEPAAGGARR